MKKLCKQFFICTIICTIWAFPLNVYASNQDTEPSTVVEYDLSSNEKADYTLKNKNGEIYYLSIAPLDTTQRINNGTHQITVTKKERWKAGFITNISSNKFISISSPYASAIKGTTRNIKLQKITSTHSKLSFLYSYLNTSSTEGFNAKIVNGSINYSFIN